MVIIGSTEKERKRNEEQRKAGPRKALTRRNPSRGLSLHKKIRPFKKFFKGRRKESV